MTKKENLPDNASREHDQMLFFKNPLALLFHFSESFLE